MRHSMSSSARPRLPRNDRRGTRRTVTSRGLPPPGCLRRTSADRDGQDRDHPGLAVASAAWVAPRAVPRRLIYALPQRSLVEQVAEEAEHWLDNLGLTARWRCMW